MLVVCFDMCENVSMSVTSRIHVWKQGAATGKPSACTWVFLGKPSTCSYQFLMVSQDTFQEPSKVIPTFTMVLPSAIQGTSKVFLPRAFHESSKTIQRLFQEPSSDLPGALLDGNDVHGECKIQTGTQHSSKAGNIRFVFKLCVLNVVNVSYAF